MFEAIQDRDKYLLSRLVTGGFLKSRRYAVGSFVLYHSIISGPLFSPFPFSARVDMHVEASETVASDSIDLAHCLQFIVPQLCLARPSPHFLMVQWASHCPASRDDPERLGGIPSHPLGSELEARRDSLSARMVIPFGFTSNGSTHIHSPRSCPKIGSHQRRCGELTWNGLYPAKPQRLRGRDGLKGRRLTKIQHGMQASCSTRGDVIDNDVAVCRDGERASIGDLARKPP